MTDNNRSPWWAERSKKPTYALSKVRRFDFSSLLTFSAIAVLLGTGIIWTLIGHDPSKPREGQFNSIEYPASINGVLAQCGGIFVFDNIFPQHYGVIPDEVKAAVQARPEDERKYSMHPMVVPVYGFMEAVGVDSDEDQFFNVKDKNYPSREAILRSMYDGLTVIWFDSALPESTLRSINAYVTQAPDIIAVEWNDHRTLPLGRSIAVSTWGASQSCHDFYVEVINEFTEQYPSKTPGMNGEEPPFARLDEQGELYKISLVP